MSDIRTDAEHVAKCDDDWAHGADESDLFGAVRRGQRVAAAWLKEHPADDGEPVTADWLKYIWAEETIPGEEWVIAFDDLNPAITLTRQDRCWSAELGHGDFSYGNWPHDIVDRRQVRDICRALGIQLKGGA